MSATLAPRADARAQTLADGAKTLGVQLASTQCERMLAYLDLLAKWNRTYNLTAIREPEHMLTHHALDALAVLPQLPTRANLAVLDVGSGGGIPGIPLAIMRPDWRVTLVDASRKKASFLTQATIELGLSNVDVHAARVEDLVLAAPCDIVISRAFAALADFVRTSARHIARDGTMAAMKGQYPEAELAALPAGIAVIAAPSLAVPGLDAVRHVILMQCAKENG